MNRVNVIIPCYNTAKYIDRCLESVTAQTLGLDLMEIILVDDGSTDDTSKKIDLWKKKYHEKIIVINQNNQGQSAARNVGLSRSTCEYIAFIDSDDWIEKNYLKTMYDIAEKQNCDIVQCSYVRDSSQKLTYLDITESNSSPGKTTVISTLEERKEIIISKLISSNAPFKLIKRKLLTDNDIFFYDGLRYEDISFGLMLSLYARTVHVLPMKLYHYYVNPKSTVLTMNESYHFDLLKIWKTLWKELLSKGFMKDYKPELELEYVYSCILIFWKIMVLRFDEPPYEYYEELYNMTLKYVPDIINNKYVCSESFNELHRFILIGTINHLSFPEFIHLADNIKKIGL